MTFEGTLRVDSAPDGGADQPIVEWRPRIARLPVIDPITTPRAE